MYYLYQYVECQFTCTLCTVCIFALFASIEIAPINKLKGLLFIA